MDANQLEINNMAHTSSAGTGYSWNNSEIRTYLNAAFLTNLESKITNKIVSTEICADPSVIYDSKTYGGYLISELSALGKTSSCTTTVTDKVRLISPSEYYNMSPYYTSASSSYPNVGNYITRISTSSDYELWLYCNSTSCGNSSGYWWTMGSSSGTIISGQDARFVLSGNLGHGTGSNSYGVRPVITIVK